MLLNCYYFGPQYHTLLPKHLDWDLQNMAKMGTDIVSFCMEEPYASDSQLMIHYHTKVRHIIDRIHKHGMEAHAVPSRWGRLVAGWIDGTSLWTLKNANTLVNRGDPEVSTDLVCDPCNGRVIEHFRVNLKELVITLGFDGIVWDEPRLPAADVATLLDDLSGYVKSLRSEVTISLFAEAGTLAFAHDLAKTKHIDYLGADGHLRSEDHHMARMKNTIFTTHDYFTPVLKKAGKKTFFLIEGQRHRDENLDNYLENVGRAFSLPMDQLMYYYCAHEMNMENGEVMTEATWKEVCRIAYLKK